MIILVINGLSVLSSNSGCYYLPLNSLMLKSTGKMQNGQALYHWFDNQSKKRKKLCIQISWNLVILFLLSYPARNGMYDCMIEFNGILSCVGLFYDLGSENQVHCPFLFTFLSLLLKCFLLGFFWHTVAWNQNNLWTGLFDPYVRSSLLPLWVWNDLRLLEIKMFSKSLMRHHEISCSLVHLFVSHFKNGPKHLKRGKAQAFITNIRFLLSCLLPRSFLVL